MLNLVVREIVERAQNDRLEHHNRIPRLASRPRFFPPCPHAATPPQDGRASLPTEPPRRSSKSGSFLASRPVYRFPRSKKPHLTHQPRLPLSTNRQPDSKSTTPEKGEFLEVPLNKMVSGEVIEANRMRQDSFTFRSMSHLLIVGNTQPSANAASGIWRRLAQAEFRHAPAHPDKELKQRLLDDLPGIATWCLTGLQRWPERGHLPPAPREIQEAVARYENAADPVAAFIAEHTTPSPGNRNRSERAVSSLCFALQIGKRQRCRCIPEAANLCYAHHRFVGSTRKIQR